MTEIYEHCSQHAINTLYWNDNRASHEASTPTEYACLPTHRCIAVKLNEHLITLFVRKMNYIVVDKYDDIVS